MSAERYTLLLVKDLEVIAHRTRMLGFDGIGHNGTLSGDEEYMLSRCARELYRDAAYKAGKWPSISQ